MIAQELRVGNLIFDQEEGKYYQIEEIREDDNGFEGYFVTYRNGSCSILVEHIDPIPLSEDWLRRLGAIDHEYSWELGPISLGWGWRTVATGERGAISVEGHSHIKYVHQLQNLFFALTGQELKLKGE